MKYYMGHLQLIDTHIKGENLLYMDHLQLNLIRIKGRNLLYMDRLQYKKNYHVCSLF